VARNEFRHSGFTDSCGARFVGWNAVSTLVEQCRRLVGDGERFVYGYYPSVDTVAHEYGLHALFQRHLEIRERGPGFDAPGVLANGGPTRRR
jgi:hypothetical protein